jgi:hypothetical protein
MIDQDRSDAFFEEFGSLGRIRSPNFEGHAHAEK